MTQNEFKKYPAWKEALELFRAEMDRGAFKYDTIVPHDWFYTAFSITQPSDDMPWEQAKKTQLEYMAQFVRFREAVQLEDLLYLDAERSIGYRIVAPSDQTQKAMERASNDMKKVLTQAARAVGNIRTQELTDEKKRENMDARAKISSIVGLSKRIESPF